MKAKLCVYVYSDSEEDTAERYLNEDAQRLALEELTDVHFTFEIRTVKFLLFYIFSFLSKKFFLFKTKDCGTFHKLGSMFKCVSVLCICLSMCLGAVGAHVSRISGRHSLGFECVSVGM